MGRLPEARCDFKSHILLSSTLNAAYFGRDVGLISNYPGR